MKVKKIVIEAEEIEATKADGEEAAVEETKTEETAVTEAPAAEEKSEEAEAEVKTEEEAPAEEAKAEEGVEATEEVKSEEAPAEAKVEEAEAEKPAEQAKEVADKSEMQKADDQEIVVKLDFSDFKEQFEKMVSPLIENVKSLTEKVDGLAKAAPTEGAADAEETPTEVAEEAPKEEVKKSDTSSEGASDDKNSQLMEMMSKFKNDLEARLTKIEEQPVPSKVVVVRPGTEEGKTEIQKIDDRLSDIAKMRDTDPVSYMRNRPVIEEAMNLIAEKRRLTGAK